MQDSGHIQQAPQISIELILSQLKDALKDYKGNITINVYTAKGGGATINNGTQSGNRPANKCTSCTCKRA